MPDNPAPRVSIIFCGGCNPRIDRGLIADAIACRLADCGCTVVYNDRAADLLVCLSGCTAGCAGHDAPAGSPAIAVAAAAVDAVAVPEEQIADVVAAKAEKYLGLK